MKNELLEEIKVSDVARENDAAVMSASFKKPAPAIRMPQPGGASGPVAVGQDYASRTAEVRIEDRLADCLPTLPGTVRTARGRDGDCSPPRTDPGVRC